MDTNTSGGCLCGAARYEITGEPFAISYCHCENCGTPLTWEGDGGELGPIIDVHISTFDDPEKMVPTSHAFEPERISWFDVADNLPRFEGFSDMSPLLHHGLSAKATPDTGRIKT